MKLVLYKIYKEGGRKDYFFLFPRKCVENHLQCKCSRDANLSLQTMFSILYRHIIRYAFCSYAIKLIMMSLVALIQVLYFFV